MERDQQHTETKRRRYRAAPAAVPEPSVQQPLTEPVEQKTPEPEPQMSRREAAVQAQIIAKTEARQHSTATAVTPALSDAAPKQAAPEKRPPVKDAATLAAPTKQKNGQTKPSRLSGAGQATPSQPTARNKSEKSEQPIEKRTPESFDMRYSQRNQPVTKNADAFRQKPAGNIPSEKRAPSPASDAPEAIAAEKNGNRPPLKKRLPYYIGIAVCSIVLIVSGTLLIRYYSQVWRANRASNQLRTLYTAPSATDMPKPASDPAPTAAIADSSPTAPAAITAVTAPPAQQTSIASANDHSAFLEAWPKRYPGNEGMVIQPRFEPLRHENRDIVGWLSIDGVLDEPVFQRDNSYYLTHDANGTDNPTGALFLDENCNLRTVPMMTLIHGHNMKEGAMFGSLKKYKVKDASFYRQHPFVTFDTLYETATYVIFSVAEINIVPGNTHYFPFWHRFSFDSQQGFDSFVLLAKEYSRFKVDIDVQPGDRLLTLATCSSEDSNLRLIVMARMLRKDEDKVMLSNKIYSAVAK